MLESGCVETVLKSYFHFFLCKHLHPLKLKLNPEIKEEGLAGERNQTKYRITIGLLGQIIRLADPLKLTVG